MILAIIQTLPNHPRHVVRTDSFAKFQNICGMLEQTNSLAAHAACHATMNGISRTLAKDADISDKASIEQSIDALFDVGPFDALVLPGLTDFEIQKATCECCQNHVSDFEFRLFLDPPKSCAVAEICKLLLALDFDDYPRTPKRRCSPPFVPRCTTGTRNSHMAQRRARYGADSRQ